jgi:hypothetical protein
MSQQIQCAAAETKYKSCDSFKQNEQKIKEKEVLNNMINYQKDFDNKYQHYLSLRNANKTLNASIEPIMNLSKQMTENVSSSEKELEQIETQVNSYENELRETNLTKPTNGPFGTKNYDSGIQVGFYIFFTLFLISLYLYLTFIVWKSMFSFVSFIGVLVFIAIIVYFIYQMVNKYFTQTLYLPDKTNSVIQTIKKIVQ